MDERFNYHKYRSHSVLIGTVTFDGVRRPKMRRTDSNYHEPITPNLLFGRNIRVGSGGKTPRLSPTLGEGATSRMLCAPILT